jgi:hypothetical protein
LAVARGRVGTVEELPDPEPLRPDAIDRRDRSMEDVIQAFELGRPFEREDVQRLIDDAQPMLVASRIPAAPSSFRGRGGRYLFTGRVPCSGIRSMPPRAATMSDTSDCGSARSP